jgi:hypothetical protein
MDNGRAGMQTMLLPLSPYSWHRFNPLIEPRTTNYLWRYPSWLSVETTSTTTTPLLVHFLSRFYHPLLKIMILYECQKLWTNNLINGIWFVSVSSGRATKPHLNRFTLFDNFEPEEALCFTEERFGSTVRYQSCQRTHQWKLFGLLFGRKQQWCSIWKTAIHHFLGCEKPIRLIRPYLLWLGDTFSFIHGGYCRYIWRTNAW